MKIGFESTILLLCLLLALAKASSQVNQTTQSMQQNLRVVPRISRSDASRQDSFDLKINEIDSPGSKNPIDPTEPGELYKTLVIAEPYKSLIQSTTRLALAQTTIPNHVGLETMMSLLTDATNMLIKPGNLLVAIKLIFALLIPVLGLAILLPGGPTFLMSVWQDPLNLDTFYRTRIADDRTLSVVSLSTEEFIQRVGLSNKKCRERSVCHFGQLIRYLAPETSQSLIKFARSNLSSSSSEFRKHSLVRAFILGFVDRECKSLDQTLEPAKGVCMGDMFSFISSTLQRPRPS